LRKLATKFSKQIILHKLFISPAARFVLVCGIFL
jgi:hypothetical protein